MAVIVRHSSSQAEFVLLGPGYGAYMAMRGNMVTEEKWGEEFRVATCDGRGIIQWFDAKDVTVVEIDGVPTSEVLEDRKQRAASSPS